MHFSHVKPRTHLATAGSFHKDFNSSVTYEEPLPFVCVELTTRSLHMLSLFVLIHPACATQDFREFSHSPPQRCLFWTKGFWHALLFPTWGLFFAFHWFCCPSLPSQFCCILLTKGKRSCSQYSRRRWTIAVYCPFSLVRSSAVLPSWPFSIILSI